MLGLALRWTPFSPGPLPSSLTPPSWTPLHKTRREAKNEKFGWATALNRGQEREESAKCWASPPFGAPHSFRAPTLWAPTLLGFAPLLSQAPTRDQIFTICKFFLRCLQCAMLTQTSESHTDHMFIFQIFCDDIIDVVRIVLNLTRKV